MESLRGRIKRAFLLATVAVLPITTLTGCNEFTMKSALSSYADGIGNRFSKAESIAESLKNSGFISDEMCASIIDNIDRLDDDISALQNGAGNKDIKKIEDAHELVQDSLMVDKGKGRSIYKAISALRPLGGLSTSNYNVDPGDDKVYGTDGQAEDYAKDKGSCPLKWTVISNYIMANNDSDGDLDLWMIDKSTTRDLISSNGWLCANGGIANSSEKCQGADFSRSADMECNPVEIVPDELVEELNSKFEYEVYVLNPDLYQNYGNSSEGYNNSFDAMAGDIQSALNSNDLNALDNYFSVAKDSSGNRVTLRTILNNNGVTNEQLDNLVCDSTLYTSSSTENVLALDMEYSGEESFVKQSLGKDILVTQNLDDGTPIGVMQVRVKEFNYETAETINSVIGIFSDEDLNSRYKVIQDGDVGGRVYLVEYPVYAMNGFEVTSSSGSTTNVAPSYALSGIGINFSQGHIVNYAEENGKLTYKSTVAGKNWGYSDSTSDATEQAIQLNGIDMYYTSSLFGDDPKNSSFVVAGKSALAMGLDGKRFRAGTSEKTISKDVSLMCPRIVLRDYIESTYAPEFTNDTNVAAFGRKVRFSVTEYINSSGQIIYPNTEPIAFYVDQAGNKLPTSSFLHISDFCDLDELTNSNTVKKIVATGKQPGTIEAAESTVNSQPLISELECVTVGSVGSKINPFAVFPGTKIGTDDYANFSAGNIRQRMWSVCVYGGVYNTDLLTDWVDSDDTVASLDWWNEFLKDNGYGYSISKEEIVNYVNKAYASQIASVSGDVIISLDTIKDISDIYEKEDNIRVASIIRTAFLIVGWVLMVYSLLLMLCWAMDTNTDLGLGLMEKVTFGHWTAVKYASDVPQGDTGEHSYLAFNSLMIRVAILIVVGILLINLDIFALVSTLINLFGKAASAIEDLIKGN